MTKEKYNLIVFIIFATFFAIGITSYDDYGMSWDEYIDRVNGFVSLNYIRDIFSLESYGDFPKLQDYRDANYGVIFNLPMAIIEKMFSIDDIKQVFLVRHFFNFFIYFISSIFFFLLLRLRFSKELSLIGLLFFYFSPRIFANSFYNNKDIVFLSFFIISVYFLIKFLNKISYKNALLLAFTCALSITDRVLGIITPFIVLFFYSLRALDDGTYFRRGFFQLVCFFIFLQIFVVIFWPYLWINPIENFLITIKDMSAFEWRGGIFYFGEYISGLNLPWHYPIVWITISTPILYLFLFLVGSYLIFIRFSCRFINISKEKKFNDIYRGNKERLDLIVFLIFFFTIFLVIKLNSTMYNGWRQLYFIYPCLIFISIRGLEFISRKTSPKLTYFMIFPFVLMIGFWMVSNHPFQFAYFNKLAGDDIRNKFEIDYYGTSNRSSLDFIVKKDFSNNINVFVASESPYYRSVLMLDKFDRNRIKFVKNINESNYIVTNHFYQNKNPIKVEKELNNKFKLFKVFKVNGIPINSIYINK